MVALVTRVKNKFRCDIQQIDGLCDDICIESWFGLVYMQTPTNCCQFFKISLHFCSSWHNVYDKIGKIENGFFQKCACTQLVVSHVKWKKNATNQIQFLNSRSWKTPWYGKHALFSNCFWFILSQTESKEKKEQTEVNGRKKKINAKYLLFIQSNGQIKWFGFTY